MLSRFTMTALLAIALAWPGAASAGEPPPRRERSGESEDPPGRNGEPGRRVHEADHSGGRRKGIERAPKRESETDDKPMTKVVSQRGCHLRGMKKLERALLGLQNRSQLMTLEVWGDAKTYRPGQKVLFFFRSPRDAWVTLFWLGPNGDIIVPISNVRIPGNRNVSVDSGGIIVPPLGREQWVAVSHLEPLPIKCGTEAEMLKLVTFLNSIPRGVGRWEVVSE